MNNIVDALRAFGKKLTGTDVTSDTIANSIGEIAEKYTGGGNGAKLIFTRPAGGRWTANMSFDEVNNMLLNGDAPQGYMLYTYSNDSGETIMYYNIVRYQNSPDGPDSRQIIIKFDDNQSLYWSADGTITDD